MAVAAAFNWIAKRGLTLLGSEVLAMGGDTTAETVGVDESTEIYNLSNAANGISEVNATTGFTKTNGLENLESVEVFATPDGPELVTNGDGSSITGWTTNNGTLSLNGGNLKFTVTTGGVTSYFYQAITTVVGQVYVISVDFNVDNVTGNTFFNIGTTAGGSQLINFNMGSTTGTYTTTFKATSTTTYVSLYNTGSALANDYIEVDNISVKSTYELVEDKDCEDGNLNKWTTSNCTVSLNAGRLRTTVTTGGSASWVAQGFTTIAGQVYTVSVDISAISSTGSPSIYVGTTASSTDLYAASGLGVATHTFKFKATGTTSYILLHNNSAATGGDTIDWDNISVKITDDLVENGNFLDSTNSQWILGTGWSIASGVASCAAASVTTMYETSATLVTGKPYVVTYTVSNYVSGTVRIDLGGTTGTTRSANGTYQETLIMDAAAARRINVVANSSFAGDVDDISVIPLVDVDTGTYSILASQSTTGSGSAGAYIDLDTAFSLLDGQAYTLSFNIRHIGSGNVWDISLSDFNTAGHGDWTMVCRKNPVETTYTTYTYNFVHSAYTRYLVFREDSGNYDGGVFIDNISIKKIGNLVDNPTFNWQSNSGDTWIGGTGWTLPTGPTTNRAIASSATGSLYQDVSAGVLQGNTYVVTYTVSNYSTGNVTCHLRGTVGTARSANGTYTETFLVDSAAASTTINFYPGANFTGDISNVEIREAIILPDGVTAESLEVHGEITKTAVNTGAELTEYTGFSANNYLYQKYNSALDPGTSGLSVVFATNYPSSASAVSRYIFDRDSNPTGKRSYCYVNTTGLIVFGVTDGTIAREVTSASSVFDDKAHIIICVFNGEDCYIYIDDALDNNTSTASALATLSNSTAVLYVGTNASFVNPHTTYGISLFRYYAGVQLTAVQRNTIYNNEIHLFSRYAYYTQEGSQYTTSTVASVKEAETKTVDNRNISIGGNIEALVDRDDEFIDLQTDYIRFDELSEWREMFYALRGDVTFAFTPGQGYEPDEEMIVSLENRDKREKRQNDSIYHKFDMTLRKRA